MEDYAPILWVLLTVAAMVYSGVTKARKQTAKADKQPPKHFGDEAWPSIEPETHQPEAERVEPFAPYTPFTPETLYTPEAQSLEEIPEQEYVPEFTVQKAAGSSSLSRNTAVDRLQSAPAAGEIGSDSLADETPEGCDKELTEEFDLRRAVIYSEILKPKFNADEC